MTGHVRVLLAEAAGTFMFFFVGAGAIIATGGDNLIAIALAHGLGLSVAVSAFGWISGGHFNPAVTFGLAVAGKDRKSTRLNSSHSQISYAVFCLKKKKKNKHPNIISQRAAERT